MRSIDGWVKRWQYLYWRSIVVIWTTNVIYLFKPTHTHTHRMFSWLFVYKREGERQEINEGKESQGLFPPRGRMGNVWGVVYSNSNTNIYTSSVVLFITWVDGLSSKCLWSIGRSTGLFLLVIIILEVFVFLSSSFLSRIDSLIVLFVFFLFRFRFPHSFGVWDKCRFNWYSFVYTTWLYIYIYICM